MTGASQNEAYKKGSLHDQGRAWDFRSKHLAKPMAAFLELTRMLKGIDKNYKTLYHDSGTGMHFHVEYNGSAKQMP